MADTITVMTSPHLDTPEVVDQIQLPNTLAGLIETAIADALSLDPETYFPKSQQWHNPNTEGCVICLAGCIIARTLHAPASRIRFPSYYPVQTENKLVALDSMRCGYWNRAFYVLFGRDPEWEIGNRLSLLPRPAHVNFNGWDQFDLHLASLESIIPELREIEAAAFPSYALAR